MFCQQTNPYDAGQECNSNAELMIDATYVIYTTRNGCHFELKSAR